MSDAHYFSGGLVRWQLGFGSPNQAALLVACILPFCFFRPRCHRAATRWLYFALGLAEFQIWYLLGRTASRGGLVAAFCAVVIYHLYLRVDPQSRKWRWSELCQHLMIALLALLVTGIGARLSPHFIAVDGASVNRFVIWRGGLDLYGGAPVWGWDAIGTGWHNFQWSEPLGSTVKANNLVSGWLDLAVRWGIFGLAPALLCFSLITVHPFEWIRSHASAKPSAHYLVGASSASLVAFAVGNVFSSLFTTPALWIIPSLSLTALTVYRRRERTRDALPVFRGAVGLSLCLYFTFLALALYLHAHSAVPFSHRQGVTTLFPSASSKRRILFVPDRNVLGFDYGRRIREAIIASSLRCPADVLAMGASLPKSPNHRYNTVFLFGRYAALAPQFTDTQVVVVHPTGEVDSTWKPGRVLLYLPKFDYSGSGWLTFAARKNIKINYTNDGASFTTNLGSIVENALKE